MALGRGLSSLITQKEPEKGDSAKNPMHKESVLNVPIEKIFPNPHQPRKKFDQKALEDLSESIKKHGILQPIVLIEKEEGGEKKYQIIAGERRYRASKLAGLKTIPAILKGSKKDKEQLELAILENVQREDLTPIEKAMSYKKLADEFGMTHAEIAERVGRGRVSVTNTIRLLELPEDVKTSLEAGEISENHARAILSLEDPEMQKKLLSEIKTNKLSARNTEVAARAMQKKPSKGMAGSDPMIKEAATRLEGYLGTKVTIKPGKHVSDGGEIVLKYFSKEDLNSILDKITNK